MGDPSTARKATIHGRPKNESAKRKNPRKKSNGQDRSHRTSDKRSARLLNTEAGNTGIATGLAVAMTKRRKRKWHRKPERAMSKQAKKRKLKRQAAKLKRLQEIRTSSGLTKDKPVSAGNVGLIKAKDGKERRSRKKNPKKQDGSADHKKIAPVSHSLNVDRNIENTKRLQGGLLEKKTTTFSSHLMLNAIGPGNIYDQDKSEKKSETDKTKEDDNKGKESRKRKRPKSEASHLKTTGGEHQTKPELSAVAVSDEMDVEMDRNLKVLKKIKCILPVNREELKKKTTKGKLSKTNPEVWFDVDPELLESTVNEDSSAGKSNNLLVNSRPFSGRTKYIGMDCEMVGIGDKGEENMLARVSLVNQHGVSLYDKFVSPQERVTFYRTHVSGIRKKDLDNAEDFSTVQTEVFDILKGRILVGHAIHNDLKVLFLNHPKSMIRDTAKYKPFKERCGSEMPSLKKLSALIMQVKVQTGEHNSVEDAQAAMKLFMLHRQQWEKELAKKHVGRKIKIKKSKVTPSKISSSDTL